MSTEEREEKVEVSEFAQLKQQVFLLTQSLQAKLSRQDFDLVSVTQDLASVKHQLSILQSQQELDSVLEDSGDSSTSEAEIIQLRTDVDKLLELLRLENSYELTGESGQVVVEWVGPNRKEVRLIDKTIHRFQPKTHGKYPGKIFFSEGTWFWPAPNPSYVGDPYIMKSATLVTDEVENVVAFHTAGTYYVIAVLDVEEESLSLKIGPEQVFPGYDGPIVDVKLNERPIAKVDVEVGSGDDAGSVYLGPIKRVQLGDIWSEVIPGFAGLNILNFSWRYRNGFVTKGNVFVGGEQQPIELWPENGEISPSPGSKYYIEINAHYLTVRWKSTTEDEWPRCTDTVENYPILEFPTTYGVLQCIHRCTNDIHVWSSTDA